MAHSGLITIIKDSASSIVSFLFSGIDYINYISLISIELLNFTKTITMEFTSSLVGLAMAFGTLTAAAPFQFSADSTTIAESVLACIITDERCDCSKMPWACGFAAKFSKGKSASIAVPVATPTGIQ